MGRGGGGGGSAEGRREGQGRCEGDAPLSVLDPPDGLDLRSLGMEAKLTVTLVLSAMTVTLHDVLVATVTRELVAHEAVTNQQKMYMTRETKKHLSRENLSERPHLKYFHSFVLQQSCIYESLFFIFIMGQKEREMVLIMWYINLYKCMSLA